MRYLFPLIFFFIFRVGYAQHTYRILKDTADTNSIVLKVQRLKEFEVSSRRSSSILRSGSVGISMDVNELKGVPQVLGEADPFKALQYMGGISQTGEANANMYVRGGNNDQNRVLLNGCTVENPTHILGIFSVFNPDLIEQMRYIKAAIPAEYGGRLSSVIDIKNFVNKPAKIEISGNIGMIASRLSLKVPLGKRFSLYAAQRLSYLGVLVIPLLVRAGVDPKLARHNVEFYDTNLGFNALLTPNTRLSGHFYTGVDTIGVSKNAIFSIEKNATRWGNKIGGLQLSHVFSEQFSMIHNLNMTHFYLSSTMSWLTTLYGIRAEKEALTYKSDFIYLKNKHRIKAGLEYAFGKLLPVEVKKQMPDMPQSSPRFYQSTEAALYLRDEWEKGPLLLNVGIRSSICLKHPDSYSSSLISIRDGKKVQKLYAGIEPRFFVRWLFDNNSSVKLSAEKHFQYSNRVQLINMGLPLEVFVSASEKTPPASLWHFSGGYFKSLYENSWELSAEAYYKIFSGLLEYGGKLNDLFASEAVEKLLYTGRGYAYGVEFMLRKNGRKFSGWLNYALGWNFRQFDEINNGLPFWAANDRRHDLSLVGFYHVNDKLKLSAAFVYATGSRLNLPRSWYVIDGNVVLEFYKYNSFKMPDYHRLDLSLIYRLPVWNKLHSELNLSVYNLYNRANPFQVYYSTMDPKGNFEYKIKMMYLMPVLPSLSWTFRF